MMLDQFIEEALTTPRDHLIADARFDFGEVKDDMVGDGIVHDAVLILRDIMIDTEQRAGDRVNAAKTLLSYSKLSMKQKSVITSVDNEFKVQVVI